jgi:hypothetical protein
MILLLTVWLCKVAGPSVALAGTGVASCSLLCANQAQLASADYSNDLTAVSGPLGPEVGASQAHHGPCFDCGHLDVNTRGNPFRNNHISSWVLSELTPGVIGSKRIQGNAIAAQVKMPTVVTAASTGVALTNEGSSTVGETAATANDASVTSVLETSHRFAITDSSTVPVGQASDRDGSLPSGFFSTSGNQIISAVGTPVRLSCIGDPEYLSLNNGSVAIMRSQGFNCIRIPWRDAELCPGGRCNFGQFDAMVANASANNMRIIWDHHGNDNVNENQGQQANGLWYDLNSGTPIGGIIWNGTNNTDGGGTAGTVTYAIFKANTVSIAAHYSQNSTVIGFDLHNEPTAYGNYYNAQGLTGARWGSGGATDMRAMCSDTGAMVEAAAPGVLIVCQGIITNRHGAGSGQRGRMMNGQAVPGNYNIWEDLSLARSLPITGLAGHFVYSIHTYPLAANQVRPVTYGSTLATAYSLEWGYLETENIAPVILGELGCSCDGTMGRTGRQTADDDQAWATFITAYANGEWGSAGGPRFTSSQQVMSDMWWAAGNYNCSDCYPDGTLLGNGSTNRQQEAVWSRLGLR